MVRKIFSYIEKEIGGVHNAAYLLGICAFLSQCLALVRDKMLAHIFGAGTALDTYYAAFRIPDLIFALVASLVSISVLIPFLAKLIEKDGNSKDDVETKRFIDTLFSAYFLLMIVVSGIAFILMPFLSHLLIPHLTDESVRKELILLSRILLLQPIALGISNLLGSITQVTRRFFLYALSPLLYNLSIILGIIFLSPYFGLNGIVWGVVLGAVLHFGIQIPYIASIGLIPKFSLFHKFKELKKVALLSLPRTIALSLFNLELIFITYYASMMQEGSISIFNFALNLQSVPFAIIGVSYSLAAFPTLSKMFNGGQKDKFIEHVEVAGRHIIFWSLPITAMFIVLRAQIVRVILGSGNFNWQDTRLTAACLALFVVSLVGQSLELLFIRAYYAAGNTKTPLIINVISSIITIIAPFLLIMLWKDNYLFVYFTETLLKINDIPGAIVTMLPLGYSIGTIINMIILWMYFIKDFKSPLTGMLRTFITSFEVSIIMGFITYVSLGSLEHFFNTATFLGIMMQSVIAGSIGILSGVGVLSLLKSPELKEVLAIIPRKVFKEKNVVLDEVTTIE
jgi:putative peptidoglycan lipid II flippase